MATPPKPGANPTSVKRTGERKPLTPKQEAMVHNFMLYGNKTKAYAESFDTKRKGVALSISASHEFNKPHIKSKIDALKAEAAYRFEIELDQVARRYLDWIDSDITDLIDVVNIAKEKGREYWIVNVKSDLKDLPQAMRSSIKSISYTNDGRLKLELIDKKGALDSLCKLMGLMDSNKIVIADQVNLVFDSQDKDA